MNYFYIYKIKENYIKISYDIDKIIGIDFVNNIKDKGIETELTKLVYCQLLEYFDGNRKSFDFPYELKGTEFQKKVWLALLNIPYGQTASYKDIARIIGDEKASRAVGNANNKNPIAIIVPCHRVIGTNGKLVGYAGGLHIKEMLLNLEKNFNEEVK